MIWAGFFLAGFLAGIVVAFAAIMIYGAINDPMEPWELRDPNDRDK